MTKHTLTAIRGRVGAGLILLTVLGVTPLTAQTTANPRTLEFRPSPDHNEMLADGTPAVNRYDLRFYNQGAAQPFQTNSLGKPAPNSSGLIRMDLATTLTAWPLGTGITYEARVAAVGPGGVGESAQSNAFTFDSPCGYDVSTSNVAMAAGAGASSITVSTANGCSWSATSNAAWIAITAGSSLAGGGVAQFSVTENMASTPRTGTLTVAGQTVNVTQAGASCTFQLSRTAVSLGSIAGNSSIAVTAPAGCAWTATSDAAWIAMSDVSSGTGSGSVTVSVTANPSAIPRTGMTSIAGQPVTVTQAGASCTIQLSRTAVSLGSMAGNSSIAVTAPAGCAWTATSDAAWIAMSGVSSGTGSGSVTVSVTANPSAIPRTGMTSIAGQPVTVTQAGASCTIQLSRTAVSLGSMAGNSSIAVTAPAGCAWTATSDAAWIAMSGVSSGTGSGSITVSVTANPSAIPRTGMTSIAGQAVTVTQGGAAPLSVTSLRANVVFPSRAGTPITWTATAAGGSEPYSYRFWVFDGKTWAVGRGWSTSRTWTWEPPLPGTYAVQVWVRNAGSGTVYDAWRQASASISKPRVLTVTTVVPSRDSAAAGEPVTWTAKATGGRAPFTYKFWVFDGATWRVGRDWSPSSAWVWTPPLPGTYTFQVWVRKAGSSARLDALRSFGPYTATKPPALTATALTADRSAPTPAGTPVIWTAVASGGTAPYTYQFWVWNGLDWSVGRGWSTTPTWTWIPPAPGAYSVQVWIRNAGSVARYDAWRGAAHTVGDATPLTVTSLVADQSFPVPQGTPVTWTASAVGGTGPFTYKFFVYDGVAWSAGNDWSTKPTWTWVPTAAGTYSFQVWVRNAGSGANLDAFRSAGPAAVSQAAPLAVTDLTVSPLAPLVTGSPAVLTASAIGGKGPYSYQFWVFDGVNWSIGRPWSASRTFAWTPPAPGTYVVQVWVRNTDSAGAWDAWRQLASLDVIP